MTPIEIARGYIGTTEGPGPENNPNIVAMYASVGHNWVEHDTVAWCAAFVGHCLERAGLRSTRKLTARSYLDWGVPVEVSDAQSGDIAVIPRGTSSWQGHVFFIDRIEGAWVWGLGGNQGDAVTIKRYPVSKLLGARRAGNVTAAATLAVRDVQTRLRFLGYHEVGVADGQIGPRTRAAILAFRDDNGLPALLCGLRVQSLRIRACVSLCPYPVTNPLELTLCPLLGTASLEVSIAASFINAAPHHT